MKRFFLWTFERQQVLHDAVEEALDQLAMKGNANAALVAEHPVLKRMLVRRIRLSNLFGELGDGKILDAFERLTLFLLEHGDEILALILKILPLFIEKNPNEGNE